MGICKVSRSELLIGIDWLSFTIFDDSYTVEKIIELMGFDVRLFVDCNHGANGYKRKKAYADISILYDGADNMGIHVDITGGSIGILLETYSKSLLVDTPFDSTGYEVEDFNETVLSHLFTEVLKVGHFTRLDIAIDDFGANYYTPDDLRKLSMQDRIVSKWKTTKNTVEHTISGYEKLGDTQYFGSRQSGVFLRVYDKKLEQNAKYDIESEKHVDCEWIRWELQFNKEYADSVAQMLAKRQSVGVVGMGVLSNYFRIIKLDHCNKSRCSMDSKWKKFINNVSALRVTVVKDSKTGQEEIEQFEKQQGRKIAKIFLYTGGNISYMEDLYNRYEHKLSEKDIQDVRIYHEVLSNDNSTRI